MTADRSEALTRALFDFDGKRVEPLERFANVHPADSNLVAELCEFAAGDDGKLCDAATWLLKRYGITGAQLSPSQSETLLGLLMREAGWLSRIHILQMMDRLVLPAGLAAPLMQALARQAVGANVFIRAWSVHGAAALADQHPAYRDRVLDLLAGAEQDEAASVRARSRRLRKAYDWL